MQFNQELCTLLSEQIPAFYIKLLNFCERFDNCDNMSNEASGGLADLVDHACIMDETLSYGMQTPEEKQRDEERRTKKIQEMKANSRPKFVPPPVADTPYTPPKCNWNVDF